MLLYTSYFTEYTLTMAISFDRSQGCKAKWCMGSADCCLEACYTTVLHNAWTQQLGLTHPFEVWTLAVHTWAFLSNQNRSQNFVNRMELLCTTTNYNFNQQSSISLSSGFSHLHSPQTCIPFMWCVLFDNTQYATFSLLFSAHTQVQDANTSELLLINVFMTMDWVLIYASQSTTSVDRFI